MKEKLSSGEKNTLFKCALSLFYSSQGVIPASLKQLELMTC